MGMKGGGKLSASPRREKGCREFGDPLLQAGTCPQLKQDRGVIVHPAGKSAWPHAL